MGREGVRAHSTPPLTSRPRPQNPDNVKSLDNVLTYHVVSGAVTSNQLTDGEVIPTVDAGFNVTAHVQGQNIHINNARVLRADIKVRKGRGWGGGGP